MIGPCSVLGKVRICLLSFVLDAWPSLRPWLRLYARHWARNWPRPMAQTLPLPKAMGCTQAPGQGLASGLSQNPLSRLLAVSLGCGAWANPCVSAKALTTVFTKAWAKALATSTMAKALAQGFSMSLELPSDKAIGCYFKFLLLFLDVSQNAMYFSEPHKGTACFHDSQRNTVRVISGVTGAYVNDTLQCLGNIRSH